MSCLNGCLTVVSGDETTVLARVERMRQVRQLFLPGNTRETTVRQLSETTAVISGQIAAAARLSHCLSVSTRAQARARAHDTRLRARETRVKFT
jgi:hypothetical protein